MDFEAWHHLKTHWLLLLGRHRRRVVAAAGGAVRRVFRRKQPTPIFCCDVVARQRQYDVGASVVQRQDNLLQDIQQQKQAGIVCGSNTLRRRI